MIRTDPVAATGLHQSKAPFATKTEALEVHLTWAKGIFSGEQSQNSEPYTPLVQYHLAARASNQA